jgi:uncharacterized membrane protein YhaH (DUF805 family)
MFDWYKKVVFENYANFNGRARRSEYWYYALTNFLIQMVFLCLFLLLSASDNVGIGLLFYGLMMIYSLAVLIPSLAVAVRRLHDVGKSGWFYFIVLIPIIGAIWLLVLFFTEGDQGENAYGLDPKADGSEDISQIGVE